MFFIGVNSVPSFLFTDDRKGPKGKRKRGLLSVVVKRKGHSPINHYNMCLRLEVSVLVFKSVSQWYYIVQGKRNDNKITIRLYTYKKPRQPPPFLPLTLSLPSTNPHLYDPLCGCGWVMGEVSGWKGVVVEKGTVLALLGPLTGRVIWQLSIY